MREDGSGYPGSNLHFHNGGTCHGHPTLKACVDSARRHLWFGKVLERTDTYEGSTKKVKCYSLIADYFDFHGKRGRYVATLEPYSKVTYTGR